MTDRHLEHQYLDVLREILEHGSEKREFNSGTQLNSVFGRMMRFDLQDGFPLLTTKKVFFRGIVHELVWFLRGETNIKYLVDNDVHIWDDWAYKGYQKAAERGDVPERTKEEFIAAIKEDSAFAEQWGELGPVYGRQWRRWPASDGREIDQLAWAIEKTKKYPDRKHVVVSAWNPEYVYEMAAPETEMALPPCHTMFNLNVTDGKLSLALYQRSADMFLGVPFNIASYALLTKILAHLCGYEPGTFVHTLGDAHLYGNHFEQAREQLSREPGIMPNVHVNPDLTDIDEITFDDITLEGYDPHPAIKGEVTVVGGYDARDRNDDRFRRQSA